MQILKPVLSENPPMVKDALWIKPVQGGFEAYVLIGGSWVSQKAGAAAIDTTDLKSEIIGSVKDKKSANTINGAKKYAEDVKEAVVGKASDTSTDMTLHGLKSYVDEQMKEIFS